MTCRFDLDCFNTRRFKPYTGKMQVCANYLSESDAEGQIEGGMLLRQQNFHSFWPAVPHRHRLSPRSTRRGPHRLVAAKSDMFGGSSALIRQHSFLVIHVYSPTCFAVFLWPLASQLDLSGVGGERRKIPLGTFLTHPSRLKNSLYTAGKLIGPSPKPESPSATVCLRLTADKVWQQGL